MNPLELTDYLVAGATLLIGIAVGRRMRPRAARWKGPMCSCRHGYGFHDAGESCQAQVQRPISSDLFGDKWEWAPCRCRHYDGPDPSLFGLPKAP